MKTTEYKLFEQPGGEELKIIGGGPKGTIQEIARYYHEIAFEELPISRIIDIIEFLKELEGRTTGGEGMDHLHLTTYLGRIAEKLQDPRMKEAFFSKEIFGFYGEKMMRDFLGEFEEVEVVEKPTIEEDWRQGIDMFVKFKETDIPLAIQFTFQPYEEKKDLHGKKSIAKKVNPRSEINPKESINCPIILVRGERPIFERACDKWFRKSKEEPEKRAIDYLSKREKLYLLLQLLRTNNDEQKEIITKMIIPYLKKFFGIYCPKAPISGEMLVPLKDENSRELEGQIEYVRTTKDREL